MTKINTKASSAPAPLAVAGDKSKSDKKKEQPKETLREMVEQFVVAILLAILVRGFDAEAFVIPTGSMAPTLKGKHREITCPQCSSVYTVNTSEYDERHFAETPSDKKYESAICDNCRFPTVIGSQPNFKGDRILVMKFPYEFQKLPYAGGPNRWEVVVFHYPNDPQVNFIKRLVGMPGEDLQLHRGNVYVRPIGSTDPFEIARKPLSRVQAMSILVNDDSHRPELLKDKPEWRRWKTSGGFTEAKPGEFSVSGEGKLGYKNLVPDPEQWEAIAKQEPLPRAPRATLITDFYSYNSMFLANRTVDDEGRVKAWCQSDWVGDLLVTLDLKVEKTQGVASIELVEAGVKNRCEVDLATGKASLYHGDTKLGEAQTKIKGTGWYSVGFSNFDDQLAFWVDGDKPFGDGLPYKDAPLANNGPTAADLDPVAVVSKGASIKVSGLVLKRDIYYTLTPSDHDYSALPSASFGRRESRIVQIYDTLSDPTKFAEQLVDREPGMIYQIRPDHFMMLGDNSPHSSDSRAWGTQDRRWTEFDRSFWEVPRPLLIGRAFFVYWPHGVPFFPKIPLSPDFLVPFRPYFERMKPIR